MAKFKFYQDKQITTWVRDYFEVDAETLEDAVKYVQAGGTLEEMEELPNTKATFLRRDWDWMQDAWADLYDLNEPTRYVIFSCDLEDSGECDEIAGKY